jgi:hypothetical protein
MHMRDIYAISTAVPTSVPEKTDLNARDDHAFTDQLVEEYRAFSRKCTQENAAEKRSSFMLEQMAAFFRQQKTATWMEAALTADAEPCPQYLRDMYIGCTQKRMESGRPRKRQPKPKKQFDGKGQFVVGNSLKRAKVETKVEEKVEVAPPSHLRHKTNKQASNTGGVKKAPCKAPPTKAQVVVKAVSTDSSGVAIQEKRIHNGVLQYKVSRSPVSGLPGSMQQAVSPAWKWENAGCVPVPVVAAFEAWQQEQGIYSSGDDVYQVENLLQCKHKAGGTQYLVKWIGWDLPTWEPIENISQNAIEEFTAAQIVVKRRRAAE